LNAQLRSETANYVNVYDCNTNSSRKLAKTSICGVRIAAKNFGVVF